MEADGRIVKKSKKTIDNWYNLNYTIQAVAIETSARHWIRGLSSAGRASALQAEGHRFEPCRPHPFYILIKYGGIAQLARAHGSYPWCREFKSPFRYV